MRVNACLNTVTIEWLKMVWKGFVNSDIDEKAMPRKPFSFRGMGKGLVVCLYLCYDCIG